MTDETLKTEQPVVHQRRISTGTGEIVETLSADKFLIPETDDILDQALANRPFEDPHPPKIRRELDTEDLLNGLIAECHFLMRDVTLPSACRTVDIDTRRYFLGSAVELATTGAKLGEAVAKLRSATAGNA